MRTLRLGAGGRGAFKKLLLAGCSFAVAMVCGVAGLEVWLRATTTQALPPGLWRTHPERGHELRPGFVGVSYDAPVHINTDGLRDFERAVDRSPMTHRVAVFGDSMTFGIGVPIEQTFPKVLERGLEDAGRRAQVFNFGVSGYNTEQEYQYLREAFDRYAPEVVVWQFTTSNDTQPFDPPGSFKSANRWLPVRLLKDATRYLYAYTWLSVRYYGLLHGRDAPVSRAERDARLFQDDYPGWIATQETIAELVAFCRSRDATLLVAIFANNFELSAAPVDDIMRPIVDTVSAAFRRLGVSHIVVIDDAFRAFAGRERQLRVADEDSHFSGLAHELAGRQLLAYFEANGLVD